MYTVIDYYYLMKTHIHNKPKPRGYVCALSEDSLTSDDDDDGNNNNKGRAQPFKPRLDATLDLLSDKWDDCKEEE